MKKEMPALVFFLALLGLVITQTGITGNIANDLSELRVARIKIALEYPISGVPMLKIPSQDTRKYLIDGATEHYYFPYGLGSEMFFFNEKQLMPALFQQMCLVQIGQPNQGDYISYQGLPVHLMGNLWYNKRINYLGNVVCDYTAQLYAHQAITKVMELDFKLVEYTIQESDCPETAQQTLILAKEFLEGGEYERTIDALQLSWSQATKCK